ncbi:MAG: LptF/LptG family permease [Paludibacteraceae bacterium]|nr:LptF/LptG family permease [Candidatus Physcocola equi]MCQ2234111.1 LptF/LptG family permease [Paludibacteraceae bacterium]
MGIKRLHIYLIKGYLGTFFATFCVCLFIVLMQFLWRYVDDMVGKGLSTSVLLQFFYYAALSLVPMALPLSILLSSLMNFGNLGERLELLAMKASGISLFRIMKPFIVFVAIVAVGAFYYANNVLPIIQERLYILTRSMAEKSPEVEIPEGSFYQGIPNVSVYVGHKDSDTKLLENIMIYDFTSSNSTGGNQSIADNISIICADSGRIESDGHNMYLTLYNGVTFENMKNQQSGKSNTKSIPYRREEFAYKQITMEFDNSFKTVDASVTANKYIGKNMQQLATVVDSLNIVSVEVGNKHALEFLTDFYFERNTANKAKLSELTPKEGLSIDDLMGKLNKDNAYAVYEDALGTVNNCLMTCERMAGEKDYLVDRSARRHNIEWHRKLTVSVACLLFFFIGAPLGSIIRKGGLGTPIVISVFIFILYYVIDNSGYKMAREGAWYVWMGIWFSSAVLLPLGAFLTYQAATDSTWNISAEQLKRIEQWAKILSRFAR